MAWLGSYWKETTAAVVALAMLIVVVAARTRTKGRVQITLPDVVIAAIAAGLSLFLSGGISKLIVSTTGITVEKAIVSAAQRPVNSQVTPLPVGPVEEAVKGGASQIPELVRRQVQALEFLLGMSSYNPDAVRQYLETLSQYPFFRFVVFLNPDRTFFGIVDAKKLVSFLQDSNSGQTFASFTTLISRAPGDRAQFAKLPGFVADAVKSDANKREVLEQMEAKNTDWLPVRDPNGHFKGIVDRSRLIASLILDVTNQVAAASPQG